jgi:hypothetical protein
MPGSWLARIGHRMLHTDTFTLMLSPAIADFQFEAPAGISRACHYFAILRAFFGALRFDICGDLVRLTEDIGAISVLTAIQASYYAFMLVLFSGLGTERVATLDLNDGLVTRTVSWVVVICAVCLVTSSACFWPPRRTCQSQIGD